MYLTHADIDYLFSTGYYTHHGDPTETALLTYAINNGWVRVDRVSIPEREYPDGHPPGWVEAGGQHSEAHRLLKWRAWLWLREIGEPDPLYEWWCPHGKADVWSPRLGIAVECGNTMPIKVLDGLEGGESQFVLLPYNSVGFSFTAQNPLRPGSVAVIRQGLANWYERKVRPDLARMVNLRPSSEFLDPTIGEK